MTFWVCGSSDRYEKWTDPASMLYESSRWGRHGLTHTTTCDRKWNCASVLREGKVLERWESSIRKVAIHQENIAKYIKSNQHFCQCVAMNGERKHKVNPTETSGCPLNIYRKLQVFTHGPRRNKLLWWTFHKMGGVVRN